MELPADRLGDAVFNVGGGDSRTVLEMAERVASRIALATGRRPRVSPACVEPSDDVPLDYRITKLIESGFTPGGAAAADREIDALIQYCVTHAA
jgi:hypothetical protein